MQASDRLQEETSERKNALEAYMYDLRNKMYDALAPFIKDADRDGLSARLNELEDWLYDEVRRIRHACVGCIALYRIYFMACMWWMKLKEKLEELLSAKRVSGCW